ncbi:chlorophyll A-B binding protein [Aureococcus anophagefferens]|nr:chlorophyll A-B binding protein [Aureococcus anophagefferens]
MKLALALALAPGASAFFGGAKPAAGRAPVDTTADIGVDPGPIEPTGLFFEDKESLARRRAVEIKHGRIAMTAFIGMMVQELGITFPGSITLDGSVKFADIGTGFAAIENIPKFGLFQIVAFGFIAETAAMPASQYTGGPQNLPGGYDGSAGTIPGGYPFTTQIEDVTARNRALACELQNGRAAMLGVTGAMIHSQLDSCDHHFFYPITHN